MAARSPPPPPPPRLSGTRSSRVGWGAAVHAVSSEASGLRGEGVVDRGDIPWPSGEGSGGQRGPGGSAPAQAPLLRAPPGSERLEGISVEEVMVARMQLLEEELSSLKEELALCQVSRPPRRAGACGEARPSASALGCVAARVGDPASPARGAPSRLPAARPPAGSRPSLHSRRLSSRFPGFGFLRSGAAWTRSHTLPAPPTQAQSPPSCRGAGCRGRGVQGTR